MSSIVQTKFRISRFWLCGFFVLFFTGAVLSGGIQNSGSQVQASVASILIPLLIVPLIIFVPRKDLTIKQRSKVGLIRRFFAAQIDLITIATLLISIITFLQLFLEYISVGYWQWSYDRENFALRDAFGFILIFACFYGIYFYFKKHLELGKATVGQYIMGYKIIGFPYGKRPDYKKRLGDCLVVGVFWLFVPLFTRHIKDGVYPWDKRSNTRALRTGP